MQACINIYISKYVCDNDFNGCILYNVQGDPQKQRL